MKDFDTVLKEVFAEKADQFPDNLREAMREFFVTAFQEGAQSRDGEIDQSYNHGFTEGWDSGAHQAYVELRGDRTDHAKAAEALQHMRATHMDTWKRAIHGDFVRDPAVVGEVFKTGEVYGWRIRKGNMIIAASDTKFQTELAAKLDGAKIFPKFRDAMRTNG